MKILSCAFNMDTACVELKFDNRPPMQGTAPSLGERRSPIAFCLC